MIVRWKPKARVQVDQGRRRHRHQGRPLPHQGERRQLQPRHQGRQA